EEYPARLRAIADHRDAALKEADEVYPRRLNEIQERFRRETKQLEDAYEQKKETTRRLHEESWAALEGRWRDGLARVGAIADAVNEVAGRQFLDWHRADLDAWQPPAKAPPRPPLGRVAR